MKHTDFSKYLTDFFTKYLPGERGASPNTIQSYRDTFVLLLKFLRDCKRVNVEKLTLKNISSEWIIDFLEWLETERKSSVSTRNVRLAAIHSYFRYIQYQCPDYMHEWHKILSIPVKKTHKPVIGYLCTEGIKLLLMQPDLSTQSGRRDLALLSLMYNSGARVQEIIDLTPSMVRLDKPPTVKLVGKGRKARIVPLLEQQLKHLRLYMEENGLTELHTNQYPLFYNRSNQKLTRSGVNYILKKYTVLARMQNPLLIPDNVSCHTLRHSLAMHLLQSGVNLVYIRDILGHTTIQVTEIYARADSKFKREAIEKAYTDVAPTALPSWQNNGELLSWLKEFNN